MSRRVNENNNLEKYCKDNNMEYLLEEWHPTKNGDLQPCDVLAKSGKHAWWYLPYDDPKTGKHFEFEWDQVIYSRTVEKQNCPFLSNRVWPGYNDLETYCKDNNMEYLLEEWHPTKNRGVTPQTNRYGSHTKRWWLCGNGHEWRTSPVLRLTGSNCPFCTRKKDSH